MHNLEDSTDYLYAVITAQEATTMWRLSRNAVSQACRMGALRGRRSSQTWLITIDDMLAYQRGRYFPDTIPDELSASFARALARWEKKHE